MTWYTTRPLSDRTWLRPAGARRPSNFGQSRWDRAKGRPVSTWSWTKTLALLETELAELEARNVVIEVDVPERAMRLDGTLRADARADSPAVIVSFDTKAHGPLTYRCDRYVAQSYGKGEHWQHNVRAIALTLEALRAVDRYGATSSGEQYRGWSAISSEPFAPHRAAMTADEAWARLADLIGVPVANARIDVDRTLRLAQRAAHPDTGGSVELWASFEAAAAVVQP